MFQAHQACPKTPVHSPPRLPELACPGSVDSNSSTLNKGDFETINSVVQAALYRTIMPELNILQERLGVVPLHRCRLTDGTCCQLGDSASMNARSFSSTTETVDREIDLPSVYHETQNASCMDMSMQESQVAQIVGSEPLSTAASLRRWLETTTIPQHRERLTELIEEAEQDAQSASASPAACPARTMRCEHLAPSPSHGNADSGCQRPLRECLFKEAGVRIEDSRLPAVDSPAPCKEHERSAQHQDALIDELLRSTLEECRLSMPDVGAERLITEESSATGIVDEQRSIEEQNFTAAFAALRQELLDNMADLKDKLQTIPELTERKLTSKLLRPPKSILHGPRDLPGSKILNLPDCLKSPRHKKDKERIEHLLTSLLESIDGLKSDFREAEVQRIMGRTAISPVKSEPGSPTPVQKGSPGTMSKLVTCPNELRPAIHLQSDTSSMRSFSTMQMMNSPVEDIETKAFPSSKKFGDISVERPRVSPRGARSMDTFATRLQGDALPRALPTAGRKQT